MKRQQRCVLVFDHARSISNQEYAQINTHPDIYLIGSRILANIGDLTVLRKQFTIICPQYMLTSTSGFRVIHSRCLAMGVAMPRNCVYSFIYTNTNSSSIRPGQPRARLTRTSSKNFVVQTLSQECAKANVSRAFPAVSCLSRGISLWHSSTPIRPQKHCTPKE